MSHEQDNDNKLEQGTAAGCTQHPQKLSRRKLLGAVGAAAVTGMFYGNRLAWSRQATDVTGNTYGTLDISGAGSGNGNQANGNANASGNGNANGIRRIAEEVVQEYAQKIEGRLADRAVHAKDYGAQGDGGNETAAIQQAIDAAFESGVKKVLLPSGTCVIDAITLKEGIHLIGHNTTLILNARVTTTRLNELTFEGIVFVSNTTMNEALYMNYGENITIHNCKFSGAVHYGATLRRIKNLTVTNCHFYKNGSSAFADAGLKLCGQQVSVVSCHFSNNPNGGGVYIHSDADFVTDNVTFVNCFANNNKLHGFLTHHGGNVSWKSRNIKFVSCIANDNGNKQIYSGFAIHYAAGVQITSCTALRNREHGITLMDSRDVIINGSDVSENGCSGVRLQADWNRVQDAYSGVTDSKIVNCLLKGNGTVNPSTSIADGVLIEGNCHHIEVIHNTIKDQLGGSIRVKTRTGYFDCSHMFIDGNIITGTRTAAGDDIIWDSAIEKRGYGRNFVGTRYKTVFPEE